MNYSYDSVYSSTIECYASTPAPPTAAAAPPVCVTAATPVLSSTGYYNAPTNFFSAGFMWNPVKRLHVNGGYRVSAVNGTSDMINVRQVNGSLQSHFQSPYAAVDFAPRCRSGRGRRSSPTTATAKDRLLALHCRVTSAETFPLSQSIMLSSSPNGAHSRTYFQSTRSSIMRYKYCTYRIR